MTVAELTQSPPHTSMPMAHDASPRVRVVIVGAGISGLAVAVALKREGVSFALIEQSARVGGVIGSVNVNGFTFERGPNTILARTPAVEDLIASVGLTGEALRAPLRGQTRHIWHGGHLYEVPSGPGAMLKTRLFSLGAKLRLLSEPFINPVHEDESLERLVRRRLGDELYERAFVPMVQGIWAGNPATMSAAAAFPILKTLEREHGSLIRGMIKTMKAAAKARRESANPTTPSMISFRGGLERLPQAMAARVADELRLQTSVEHIENLPNGYAIQVKESNRTNIIHADSVVLTSEAWNTARMIAPLAPEATHALAQVHYAPLIAVGLGIESNSLSLPPGFGFLAARDQGLRVLGCIFNSNFLPGRAPEGCSTLTVMIGGDLDPTALQLNDDAILDLVRRDLKTALGWNGQLRAHHIGRWTRAIPRYGLDHAELGETLAKTESRLPGLHFFGNYYGGVSLGDRIEKGAILAKSLASTPSSERDNQA